MLAGARPRAGRGSVVLLFLRQFQARVAISRHAPKGMISSRPRFIGLACTRWLPAGGA